MTFRKIKVVSFIALMILGLSEVKSQDIHYSQFYASPLTLNPALTGKVNGSYRIAGIYRDQWKGLFRTPSGSFDMPFVIGNKLDALGAGIMISNDMQNDKTWNHLQIMASVAYHKSLGKKGNHQLSLGVQGGYVQKRLDQGNLDFASEWDGRGFGDGQTGVNIDNTKATYGDFNGGLFYSAMFSRNFTLFAGFSLFHLLTPKEDFITGNDDELARRYVVHGGLDWRAHKRLSILPGVYYQTQAAAREINFGNNFGIHILEKPGKEATLFLGAWYRWEDAVIAMAGLEYNKFRVGFSYDITTSDLNNGVSQNNAWEISLIYIGDIIKPNDNNLYLFCPRY